MRSSLLALTSAIALASTLPLRAQVTFLGLGTVPTSQGVPGLPIECTVSPDGRVVAGRLALSHGPEPLFRWTLSSGIRELAPPPGADSTYVTGLNRDGSTMVGYSSTSGPTEAFRWTIAAGYSTLDPLSGDEGAFAAGVSDDGSTIAGGSYTSERGYQPVRWTGSPQPQSLGLSPGESQALTWGVSADGQTVVGWSTPLDGAARPFAWTPAAAMHALPLPPGAQGGSAFGASADGGVITGVTYDAGVGHATLWHGDRPEYIGGLPGAVESIAFSATADGSLIAGASSFGADGRAFLWRRETGPIEVSDFLASLGADLSGWQIFTIDSMSADGRTIAGRGLHNGEHESWVAIIPSPGALPVLATAGLLRQRRRKPGQRARIPSPPFRPGPAPLKDILGQTYS